MSSAAASTSADAPGDALPSAINHIAALPTELQLELLKWTGVCSPRALWALSSTNRELRLLSESLRWKNLPAYPERQGNQSLEVLVKQIAPRFGHHVRLARLYGIGPHDPTGDIVQRSDALSLFVQSLHFFTSLRHLDISAPLLSPLKMLDAEVPSLVTTLEALTLSGVGFSDVALSELLPFTQLRTLRLTDIDRRFPGEESHLLHTLTKLQHLRLDNLPLPTMKNISLSSEAQLEHLDIRNCSYFRLQHLNKLVEPILDSLSSLTYFVNEALYANPPPPFAPTPALTQLRSLSIDLFQIVNTKHLDRFALSPIRTLRVNQRFEHGSGGIKRALDDHRATLKVLRLSAAPYQRPYDGSKVPTPAWVGEVEALCRARGIDFREGNWMAEEWEEHFPKWM